MTDEPRNKVISLRPHLRRLPDPEPAEPYIGKFLHGNFEHKIRLRTGNKLIQRLLPERRLILLFGKAGCGKSTIACGMAFAVGTGRDFLGLKVKRGGVIYLAGERQTEIEQTLAVYQQERGASASNILVVGPAGASLDLLAHPDEAKEEFNNVLDHYREVMDSKPALLIIDTLTSITPGTRETIDDFTLALEVLREIVAVRKITCVVVHHEGKDEKRGARGNSSLTGLVDLEIKVLPIVDYDDSMGEMKLGKRNRALQPANLCFEVKKVVLGTDNFGDPEEIAIVDQPSTRRRVPEREHTTVILNIVRKLLDDPDRRQPITTHARGAHDRHADDEWCVLDSDLSTAIHNYAASTSNAETTKRVLRRERERLLNEGILRRYQRAKDQPVYWLSDQECEG